MTAFATTRQREQSERSRDWSRTRWRHQIMAIAKALDDSPLNAMSQEAHAVIDRKTDTPTGLKLDTPCGEPTEPLGDDAVKHFRRDTKKKEATFSLSLSYSSDSRII
ncbi:hypothetical protein Bca52824_078848 [Brassica carinata]|uniref:Uncharacterized protein n=1 Tax=Brassica carinata TaxID=52824 RepID=A0A8X7Q1Q8_BRACI|nr:hypothetical protein Bca52824_078848 [Brassica carinata]